MASSGENITAVHRGTACSLGIRELDITLIRATNYTDDGYPIRTKIGVIRSNTLTQMATLARDLASYPFFAGLHVQVRSIDEAIQRVPLATIVERSRVPGVRSVVMLVGVQTNQYPRAMDIASWFLPHGIRVMIGGFHVSGMLAMIGLTADLRTALSRGITLVAGEVEEGRLASVVEDILAGRAEPLYNFLNPTPDLTTAPTPRIQKDDLRSFASPFSTIDTGRGCVFTCDFCTIINVQGRTMRWRNPEQVLEFVRRGYREAGVTHSFFTDDNIARNPQWRELFAGLVRIREEEHIPFTFMMQSDLAARKIPPGDFFVQAARAGCNQTFFGVESVNRENLRSQKKFQNQVAEYQDLVAHLHSMGIACHAGYILGLPFDTPESIRDDVAELQRIGFDSASFYILSPLPGSRDHQRWWKERRWMDPDFNTYDSAHVAVAPERMSREQLGEAFRKAWDQFYSVEHMVNSLRVWGHDRKEYWNRLFFFAWYLYASRVERLHPMNCGFWTVRDRGDRRPGFARESAWEFWMGRVKATGGRFWGLFKLFLELEEVWLQSRPRSRAEESIQECIARAKQGVTDWRDLKVRELLALYRALHEEMPDVKIPSGLALWLKKRNPFTGVFSRAHVQRTWRQWYRHVWNPLKWIEVWVFEGVNGMRFLRHLLTEGR
jgi:hypothetical protein